MNSTLMAIAIVICGAGGNNKLSTDFTEAQIRELIVSQKQAEFDKAKQSIHDAPAHLEGARGRAESRVRREAAKAVRTVDAHERNAQLLENIKAGKAKIPADWVEKIQIKKLYVDQTYAPSTFIAKVKKGAKLRSGEKETEHTSRHEEDEEFLIVRGWNANQLRGGQTVDLEGFAIWTERQTVTTSDGVTHSIGQIVRIPKNLVSGKVADRPAVQDAKMAPSTAKFRKRMKKSETSEKE